MIVLVMGVSGAGKTAVASLLAKRLGWCFADADDFHSKSNVQKMLAGHPLTDSDRSQWLELLHEQVELWDRERKNGLLACSALKKKYRDVIAGSVKIETVYLDAADHGEIKRRMMQRKHFMPAKLLETQYATLEELGRNECIRVNAMLPIADIVQRLLELIQSGDFKNGLAVE
jgi:carbohydrate kinase (thermoresistant glucokinase family)